ncbi:MAG: DNA-binding NtrC family response regulator [Myxococcota bacterium]
MPPVRERREDIPLLVKHFLRNAGFNQVGGRVRIKGISRDALDSMMPYRWPGNVRELVNVIERACSFAETEYIQPEDLPEHISGMGMISRRAVVEEETSTAQAGTTSNIPIGVPLQLSGGDGTVMPLGMAKTFKDAKEEWVGTFERDYIINLLRRNGANISHAAKEAEIDRKYFRKLMKKYELEAETYKDDPPSD